MHREKIEQIKFVPFGPFPLPRLSRKRIDVTKRAQFWRTIDARHPGLSKAVGCYVFAITAGTGTLPWYIGKATKLPFSSETWATHRLVRYQDVLRRRKLGTPVLFLVAKRTSQGRFARPTKRGDLDIDLLGGLMLESAFVRNRKLPNRRDIRHLQSITMPGFINAKPGRRSRSAQRLAHVLGRD